MEHASAGYEYALRQAQDAYNKTFEPAEVTFVSKRILRDFHANRLSIRPARNEF